MRPVRHNASADGPPRRKKGRNEGGDKGCHREVMQARHRCAYTHPAMLAPARISHARPPEQASPFRSRGETT
ncbi:hypothetical protein PUN4_450102 [Paraburkholderia unamae]|nr:hypothetical protein PUN4_450102 [Paraburkholderia unamae]